MEPKCPKHSRTRFFSYPTRCQYHSLNQEEIQNIFVSLQRVIPIPKVTRFEDEEGIEEVVSLKRFTSAFPLQHARAMTIQGSTVDSLMLTRSEKSMPGTTMTGLTRARDGLANVLIMQHFEDKYLVHHINQEPKAGVADLNEVINM